MSTNEVKTQLMSSGIHKGVEWETRKAPIYGAINGYARLPEGHPFRSRDLQIDDEHVLHVHGGITYGPTTNGWVGFDTLHAGDIWPDTPHRPMLTDYGIRWTLQLVEDTSRTLCEQIAAMMQEGDES